MTLDEETVSFDIPADFYIPDFLWNFWVEAWCVHVDFCLHPQWFLTPRLKPDDPAHQRIETLPHGPTRNRSGYMFMTR
jgi:hypothetical protein